MLQVSSHENQAAGVVLAAGAIVSLRPALPDMVQPPLNTSAISL